jgi:hypothetical protein
MSTRTITLPPVVSAKEWAAASAGNDFAADCGTGQGFGLRSFDNGGQAGTMRATLDDTGVWTFAGETERARLAVAPEGRTMTARWERRVPGGWEHWMDMEFTRAG